MKFKVITLNDDGLKKAAQLLEAKAQEVFAPNLYIGIRTGGQIVAESMHLGGASLLPITKRREGTALKSKSGGIKSLLKALPYWVLNPLRIAEHIYLTEIKKPSTPHPFVPDEAEFKAIESVLKDLGEDARIFVIDDALDTGNTMKAVVELLQKIAHSEAIIKSGVITQTTENPAITPDFKLYDLTLCRFPWSFDFKG